MTLEEVAKSLGMTRHAVFQLERRAMAKLRIGLGSDFTGGIGQFLKDEGRAPTKERRRRRRREASVGE